MTFDDHATIEYGKEYGNSQPSISPPVTRRPSRRRRVRNGALQVKPSNGNIKYQRHEISGLLHSHFILPTRPRIEIAFVLFNLEQHLSADQIFAAVNHKHVKTSKATVYNTLKIFVERNLIRELIIDANKVFYDRNTQPHHHFYNVDTGALIDIPSKEIRIASIPPLPDGVEMMDIEVVVRTRQAR